MHISVMVLFVNLFVISNRAVIDVEKEVVDRKIVERDAPPLKKADKYGKWTDSTIECEKPKPVWLRWVKVPFDYLNFLDHSALEFEIVCKSGSRTHYTVDFVSEGVKRRFGRFNKQTVAQKGFSIDCDLSIEQINNLTEVRSPYHLIQFNCKTFVKKRYDILLKFNEDCKKIDPNNTLAVEKCLEEAKNGSQIMSTQISSLIFLFISFNQIVCYFYF